jgi:FtsP/CotA-like multicopper oxidase with cupredoxin domain
VIEGQVGDVLEVRFANRLPQATNIHWHGLRVPAARDGTEMVQRSVAPGGTLASIVRLAQESQPDLLYVLGAESR